MFATFSFITLFAVLGVWARYGQTLLVQTVFGRGFPWATLSINVLGCFLMGFLFFETLERISVSPELRTGMLTGGLGTYTTFSTFSLETLVLFEMARPSRACCICLHRCFCASVPLLPGPGFLAVSER